MKTLNVFFLGIFALLAVSCGNISNENMPKPGATGKIGEILVIIDDNQWNSEIGDTIRAIFQASYPMLPQPEPYFKLLNIGNSSFLPVMQKHRNILLISLTSEEPEAKLTISRDLWAKPQIVLNAVGANAHDIAKIISDKRKTMLGLYEQAELDRQQTSTEVYSDAKLEQAIVERFGINLNVPSGYYIMRNDEDFMWLESQSNHNSMGVFIYTYPFVDDSTFTLKFQLSKRDSILKEKVPGSRDSSWMTTTKFLLPDFEIKEYKGLTYGEMRGLWELVNDYMGGPFVNHSYLDRAKGRVINVEGYVYAPRFDKRDYVRRMLGIINTFSLEPKPRE